MTHQRQALGQYGENLALEYLQKKGFRLLGRNLKLFCGEIDLLMQDRKDFVIVEVKTKSDLSFGRASEMVDGRKKRKLLQLAKVLWQKFPQKTVRIDVVAIDDSSLIIEHYVSAVEE